MTIRENTHAVKDSIVPENILISVANKSGLQDLVLGLLGINPQAHFYSTGGTEKEVVKALEEAGLPGNYTKVEELTGIPHMDGDLVKTLHPSIHVGLLSERNNPEHEKFLRLFNSGYFDVMVGNFYPFERKIAEPGCTPEQARGNIDIGGPAMLRAAAKNWPSVAVLCQPSQYEHFITHLHSNRSGASNLEHRFGLARRTFEITSGYECAISGYFNKLDFTKDVLPGLQIEEETKQ